MEGGGSTLGLGKGKTGTGTRRTWNPLEESILMDALKEIVVSGWKSENGFKPGYLMKLQEKMREKLPGTDIRATPHINSRLTIWKRHYGCLQSALGESGSGFNPITKVIDVSDVAWEKAVKKEPSISGMRYKPWPFYYDWIEVFGSDRATGKACEDVMDAVNELVNEDGQHHTGEHVPGGTPVNNHVEEDACEMDVESEAPTVDKKPKHTPSGSKKRSSGQPSESNKELMNGLSELFTTSDDRLEKLVVNFGNELTGNKTTKESIWAMIECIPELNLDEMLDASENLSKNPQRLEMFTDFPEYARGRYIRRLLAGDFDKPT